MPTTIKYLNNAFKIKLWMFNREYRNTSCALCGAWCIPITNITEKESERLEVRLNKKLTAIANRYFSKCICTCKLKRTLNKNKKTYFQHEIVVANYHFLDLEKPIIAINKEFLKVLNENNLKIIEKN